MYLHNYNLRQYIVRDVSMEIYDNKYRKSSKETRSRTRPEFQIIRPAVQAWVPNFRHSSFQNGSFEAPFCHEKYRLPNYHLV